MITKESGRQTSLRQMLAIISISYCIAGCDEKVAGVNFESGFMVDPQVAYAEGYEAGVATCNNQKRFFSQYKSGTKTYQKYMEGWMAGMHAKGCSDQI